LLCRFDAISTTEVVKIADNKDSQGKATLHDYYDEKVADDPWFCDSDEFAPCTSRPCQISRPALAPISQDAEVQM